MVDIHNHTLPGIDDGCKTMEEAIKTLKIAEDNGITSIILTPHYVKGSKYNKNNKDKEKLFKELKKETKNNNIDINLYLGNEVYVENDMVSLIKENEITTLNKSRYLLFELPMTSDLNNLKQIVFELRVKGIIPVIAHPERYSTIQNDPNQLLELIDQGCLFQGNLGSLIGIYGKEEKNTIVKLLKHNMLHFLATDNHHPESRNINLLPEAKKELINLVGLEYATELIELNPTSIINDEDIIKREAKEIKKKLFFF